MKLFEHEGKELLKSVGVVVPKGQMVQLSQITKDTVKKFPVVAKAQVLSGKRGKRGLVKVIGSQKLMSGWVKGLAGKQVDGEVVGDVLLEETVDILQELFVSITYSSKSRGPVLLFSDQGGVEVEELGAVSEVPLKFGMDVPEIRIKIHDSGFKNLEAVEAKVWKAINALWQVFQEKDLFLAEINPLVITADGQVVALDAKMIADDAAAFRQKWQLPERNMFGRQKTKQELSAEAIDATDHRGVVGRVFLDLPGDIGVICAGGGASLVAMDALVSYGLKPANYTEFSGNPPAEKVEKLTEVVLSKKNLKGAMLVGGKANFTDQVETLSGFLAGLEKVKPSYPIVVRRDGPRMAEAKAMLEKAAKKHGWQIVVYDAQTPIVEAVKKLTQLIKESK